MANRTLKVNRSEFPVGTSVSVFPRAAVKAGAAGKPSGAALSSATVAADGSLSFSIPERAGYALWAEVAGEHRVVTGGDPTVEPPAPTLRQRLALRRLAVGA